VLSRLDFVFDGKSEDFDRAVLRQTTMVFWMGFDIQPLSTHLKKCPFSCITPPYADSPRTIVTATIEYAKCCIHHAYRFAMVRISAW
jgi:hypothetical protein